MAVAGRLRAEMLVTLGPMANDQIEIKSEGWNAYIETPIRRLTALMVRRFLTPLPLRARSDHAEHQE
jgi:hypothetical protein